MPCLASEACSHRDGQLAWCGCRPTRTRSFTIFPLAAAWFGAGLGRTASLLLDQSTNRAPGLIPVWIPLELVLGLAIGAPILQLGAG